MSGHDHDSSSESRRIEEARPRPSSEGRKMPSIEGYEIYESIGSGAMGTVFRARHLALDRIVALKIIKRSLSRTKQQVQRLRREGKIVASLDHPNIVRGYDLGQSGGYHYLSMEYVAGHTVREILNDRTFTETEALDIGEKIALALGHANELGIIHRDVKPGNILITWGGDVKIADLGLAKGPSNPALTHSGATIGTPQYLSPEQAQDPRHVDYRTDFFSLGATLYHMTTGRPPFSGEGIGEVISKVLFAEPDSPCSVNPDLSDSMSNLIRRLLSKDPGARPQSSREIIKLIDRVRRGLPVSSPREESAKTTSPVRSGLVVGTVLAVSLLVVGLVTWRVLDLGKPDASVDGETAIATVAESARTDRANRLDGLQAAVERTDAFELFGILRDLSEQSDAWADDDSIEFDPIHRKRLDRMKERLRSFFDQKVNEVFVRLEREASEAVEADRYRDALAVFAAVLDESDFAQELGQVFRRGLNEFPDRLLFRVESRRREGGNRVRARVSRRFAESLLGGLKRRPEEVPNQGVERLRAVARRSLADQDLLLPSDDVRVGDQIDVRRRELHKQWGSLYLERENNVLELANTGRYRSARAKLRHFGEDGIFDEIPHLLSRHAEFRREIAARERDLVLDQEQLHQEFASRFPRLMTDRDYSRADSLVSSRLQVLSPFDEEIDELAELIAETRASRMHLDLVRQIWDRVRTVLDGMKGKKVRLSVRGNRNEREILDVRNEVVRYRFTGSGNNSSFLIHELDLSELRRLAAPRKEVPEDSLGLATLSLDQARGLEDVAKRKALIEDIREDLARARKVFDVRGSDEGSSPLGSFLEGIVAVVDREDLDLLREGHEQLEMARQVLEMARERFEDTAWAEAIATFESLREDRNNRAVYLANRQEIDDKRLAAMRALHLSELASKFRGKITPIPGDRNRIRIEYDFQNPEQLGDWESLGRFRVEDGALVGVDPPRGVTGAAFKERSGLRHEIGFELDRGIRLEFDLETSSDVKPLFTAISISGNIVGILSRRQAQSSWSGQVNVWTGTISDYESYFHLEGRFLREPRGIRDFAFDAGETYRIRLEITRYGRLIRLDVDGSVVAERELLKPSRKGVIEIRSWFGHRIDNVVLTGVVD